MSVYQITATGKSPSSVKVPPVCVKKEKVSGFKGVLQLSVSGRKLQCVCKRDKKRGKHGKESRNDIEAAAAAA